MGDFAIEQYRRRCWCGRRYQPHKMHFGVPMIGSALGIGSSPANDQVIYPYGDFELLLIFGIQFLNSRSYFMLHLIITVIDMHGYAMYRFWFRSEHVNSSFSCTHFSVSFKLFWIYQIWITSPFSVKIINFCIFWVQITIDMWFYNIYACVFIEIHYGRDYNDYVLPYFPI